MVNTRMDKCWCGYATSSGRTATTCWEMVGSFALGLVSAGADVGLRSDRWVSRVRWGLEAEPAPPVGGLYLWCVQFSVFASPSLQRAAAGGGCGCYRGAVADVVVGGGGAELSDLVQGVGGCVVGGVGG